jgi:hypothetical protein
MAMSRHQPALLGGLLIGVLSSLPVIKIGNLCCCLWVVSGGLLVAYLQQQRTDAPLEASEAMLGGILAGAIGAAVAFVLDSVFLMILAPFIAPFERQLMQQIVDAVPNMPPEVRDRLQSSSGVGTVAAIRAVTFFIALPIDIVFAMLGALLGLAFFKKKTPPVAQA